MKPVLGPHFFRHEYGRLVAVLSRRVGLHHLELVEDAVQSALLVAVESWGKTEIPGNPSAWLFRVAQNHFVDELRRRARRGELSSVLDANDGEPRVEPAAIHLAGDVNDSLLHMLFVCCDAALPIESQLVLALKTLCGFDVSEIAQRLFMTEANVYKRLARARSRLREERRLRTDVATEELAERVPAVRAILYALFSEGYLSSRGERAIRDELCQEARRLTCILAEHPIGATPPTFALLALMHLNIARLPARQDVGGELVLLDEQDRSLFDPSEIAQGLSWLARAAEGDELSRYHAEAGVAAEHCLAPSLAETRWDRIVHCYELLERVAPSALHTLSRALAVAELRSPAEGLALLKGLDPPGWLTSSYAWSAVLSDLHRRAGDAELAEHHRKAALEKAPSAVVRAALQRRLQEPTLR